MRSSEHASLVRPWRQQLQHEGGDALVEAREVLCSEGGRDYLREVVELGQAAHAQKQHADQGMYMYAPKCVDLGQHGVNPLTDEVGTEVVVADRGSRNLRAA